jgi:hypothetical protein
LYFADPDANGFSLVGFEATSQAAELVTVEYTRG